MAKISKTAEGATQIEVPSGKHPESHFETHRVSIEPADNGGFTVEHHKSLKKKFNGMRHMDYGYREPEKHVFSSSDELHTHLQTIFKATKKAIKAEDKEESEEGE